MGSPNFPLPSSGRRSTARRHRMTALRSFERNEHGAFGSSEPAKGFPISPLLLALTPLSSPLPPGSLRAAESQSAQCAKMETECQALEFHGILLAFSWHLMTKPCHLIRGRILSPFYLTSLQSLVMPDVAKLSATGAAWRMALVLWSSSRPFTDHLLYYLY